jgi:hypothetical protein
LCSGYLFGDYPLENAVDFCFRQKRRQKPGEEICLLPFLRCKVWTRSLVELTGRVELRQRSESQENEKVLKAECAHTTGTGPANKGCNGGWVYLSTI